LCRNSHRSYLNRQSTTISLPRTVPVPSWVLARRHGIIKERTSCRQVILLKTDVED